MLIEKIRKRKMIISLIRHVNCGQQFTTRLSFFPLPFPLVLLRTCFTFPIFSFFSFFFPFALVLPHDISLSWQISASFYFPSFPWSLSRSALLFISTLNYLLLLVCLSPACPPCALSRSFKYLSSFSLKYLSEFKLGVLLISLIYTNFNSNSCSSNSNNG